MGLWSVGQAPTASITLLLKTLNRAVIHTKIHSYGSTSTTMIGICMLMTLMEVPSFLKSEVRILLVV